MQILSSYYFLLYSYTNTHTHTHTHIYIWYYIWKLLVLLQSGARLPFASKLQETYVLKRAQCFFQHWLRHVGLSVLLPLSLHSFLSFVQYCSWVLFIDIVRLCTLHTHLSLRLFMHTLQKSWINSISVSCFPIFNPNQIFPFLVNSYSFLNPNSSKIF